METRRAKQLQIYVLLLLLMSMVFFPIFLSVFRQTNRKTGRQNQAKRSATNTKKNWAKSRRPQNKSQTMQCHLFHLSISTHIACNAQTSLKWHWTKENKEHIKELNCGKKKSNKRARIKESRPKRHTHEMNRGRKKEEGTHEQNRNEMKAAAAIRTTQQRTTQRWRRRRGTQSCIQVKTVAFQIKLPSWSFKSCLSHLKDVDYVRAHTQQKIKKKRGKKRAHNKSWKWERERGKKTQQRRDTRVERTQSTHYMRLAGQLEWSIKGTLRWTGKCHQIIWNVLARKARVFL